MPRVSATSPARSNLVGQLDVVQNPGDQLGLHAVQHQRAARCRWLPTVAWLHYSLAVQPRRRTKVGQQDAATKSDKQLRRSVGELDGSRLQCCGSVAEWAHGAGRTRCRETRWLRGASQIAGSRKPAQSGCVSGFFTNSSGDGERQCSAEGILRSPMRNPDRRIAEPYRTDFQGSPRIRFRRVDVQVSGTWAYGGGTADFTVTNAWIAAGPQPLGRVLLAPTASVRSIAPATMWGERRNTDCPLLLHREAFPVRRDAYHLRLNFQMIERRHCYKLQLWGSCRVAHG